MPNYALVFMVFSLAACGLPGTSGFVGEYLVLVGTFRISFWLSLLISLGMILDGLDRPVGVFGVPLGQLLLPRRAT